MNSIADKIGRTFIDVGRTRNVVSQIHYKIDNRHFDMRIKYFAIHYWVKTNMNKIIGEHLK